MPLTDWTWTKGSSYIFIDENHLYMTGHDNFILVFDKFTGQPSRAHPKSTINVDSLKRLYDTDLSGISTASADSKPYIFIMAMICILLLSLLIQYLFIIN